ncbi:MAG: hypothetical protein QG646_2680 [Euryarchaeota archaeon]|nr:hypothetical protein [Euryarchaeota archaeon]
MVKNFTTRLKHALLMPIITIIIGIIIYIPLQAFNSFLNVFGLRLIGVGGGSFYSSMELFFLIGVLWGFIIVLFPNSNLSRGFLEDDEIFEDGKYSKVQEKHSKHLQYIQEESQKQADHNQKKVDALNSDWMNESQRKEFEALAKNK